MPRKVEKLNSASVTAMNTTPKLPRWYCMAVCRRSMPVSPAVKLLRHQQHQEGRAAADHHGVDQDAQRLHKAHLHRVIALGSGRRTGGRTAARLVGEQAALDAVHQHRAKAARRHLPQAEGLGRDTPQHRRDSWGRFTATMPTVMTK